MNKFIFAILSLAILASACTGTKVPASDLMTDSVQASGPVKTFDVVAKQFEWIPATITVNRGDHVVLHITNLDVAHGIAIPEFNVSKQIAAGESVTVEFDATKAGNFTFHCNVYCGPEHKQMKGTLIVQ